MKVKFKKLHPEAKTPSKAHSIDAGFDLTCVSIHLEDGIMVYDTGIAVEIPEGYFALACTRSSISRYNLALTNSVGIIDAGYQGSIKYKFRLTNPFPIKYKVGDRIGQLVILPLPDIELEETSEFAPSERGEGGFGSTGA